MTRGHRRIYTILTDATQFSTDRWGYAVCALGIGYSMMLFETERFSPIKQVVEDSFILLSIILACRALCHRLDLKSNLLLEIAVFVSSAVMVVISLAMFNSVHLETLFVEVCCAIILWTTSIPFARLASKRPDRILAAAFLCLSLVLSAQCLLLIAAPQVSEVVGAWRTSVWGNLVQFTGLAASVALTFCIMVATADDAAETHRINANTDPLTNLLNRRGLEAFLASRRGREALKGPTSVILADIDHFKSINDRFGHKFGDTVIQRFGVLLQNQAGSHGCVVRLGGEEFMLLLPKSPLPVAVATADRVRSLFASQRWEAHGLADRFTASFGVSSLQDDGEPIIGAMERADLLLYAAKQSGRDRVTYQQDDPCPSPPLLLS